MVAEGLSLDGGPSRHGSFFTRHLGRQAVYHLLLPKAGQGVHSRAEHRRRQNALAERLSAH